MKVVINSIETKQKEIWELLREWRSFYKPELLSNGEYFYHFTLFYEILEHLEIVSNWIIEMSLEFHVNTGKIAEHWTKLTIHCYTFYHFAWSLLLIFKNVGELRLNLEKSNLYKVRNQILVPHEKDNLIYSTNKAFIPRHGAVYGIEKLKEFPNGKRIMSRSNIKAIPLRDIEEFYCQLHLEISKKIEAKKIG